MEWVVRRSQRLIDFLKAQVAGAPSVKAIRRALDSNACKVNGKIERFASTGLFPGDSVSFAAKAPKEQKKSLSILYEDEFLKIVDKPPGWVCEDAVFRRALGGSHWLIHRLDKDTSGLLLLAKSLEAKEKFIPLFEEKSIFKLYLALADGEYQGKKTLQESWFVRKKTFAGQTIWGSLPRGQKNPRALHAATFLEPLARGKHATLFACQPITGRTHQIRVHLAELGHPILTDRQYAERFRSPHVFTRPLLHALRLAFTHPMTGEKIDLTAPLLGDMRSAIDLVGISSGHVGELLMEQS